MRFAKPGTNLLSLALAATLGLISATADGQTIRERLALEMGRAARQSTQAEPLSTTSLIAACDLIEQAIQLDPANPDLWRIAMKLGSLAERPDLTEQAVRVLVDLDPDDAFARLAEAIIDIEQHQTIEDRMLAYERWLTPESRAKLGPAGTSRLLLDLALLHQRQGRVRAFTEALTDAIAVDPANQAAMGLAAGYFDANVDDPAGEAELLLGLLLANPADGITATRLARLLLDSGAYQAASRMYDIATGIAEADGRIIDTDLLSDQVIAAWGANRIEHAIGLISERQALANRLVRRQIAAARERGEPVEQIIGDVPLGTTISIVRAVLYERTGHADASEALEAALKGQQQAIDRDLEQEEPDLDRVAEIYLTMATGILWLGDDPDRAEELLSQAASYKPLNESAQQRFDGWLAMRRGKLDEAASLLEPLAQDDIIARLGLAITHLNAGRTRDAARTLLAINRAQPGTLVGLWAGELLFEMLGQRVLLSDLSGELNDLAATLPRFIDRLPTQSTLAFSARVVPPKPVVGVLEPWIVNVQISNNAIVPLAIDPEGPIRPQILIEPRLRVPGNTVDASNAIVIDIDRRLRLEPRERLIIPVDLRTHGIGGKLTEHLLAGSLVRFNVIWNAVPSASGATLRPGALGGESRSEPLRIDGQRVTPAWIEQRLNAIAEPDLRTDIEAVALLTHVTAERILVPRDAKQGAAERLVDRIEQALPEAYAKLDGPAQAWVLAVLGPGPARDAIRGVAQRSEDRLVRLAYLLHHVEYAQDPMLDAAARSGDEIIVHVADHVRSVMEHADRIRRESATQG